jgi:hypothetical protein
VADYALTNAWQQASHCSNRNSIRRRSSALLDYPHLWAFGAGTIAAWGRRPE